MSISGLFHLLGVLTTVFAIKGDYWSEWWSYEMFSGPSYWHLNTEWRLCLKGKHQSPVDIQARSLLFDPNLKELVIDSVYVKGLLYNSGHDVTIDVRGRSDRHGSVNISSGPLSYRYTVAQIKLHFGARDEVGSEHMINSRHFPCEMQIYAYNCELYHNLTEASKEAQGVVVVSVFVKIKNESTKEMNILLRDIDKIEYKGESYSVPRLSIKRLLPLTSGYITYEGSLTQPGCYETVTWIIMNKPVYITNKTLNILRTLNTESRNSASAILISNNYRPVKPLNRRPIRTNINFPQRKNPRCSMQSGLKYRFNNDFFVRK